MGERWLTRPVDPWGPRVPRGRAGSRAVQVTGAALALAACGQAAGQAWSAGYAGPPGGNPEVAAFLYAVPLCALALLATLPPLFLRPAGAAVACVLATAGMLVWFPVPNVGAAVAAVAAVWRLGVAGPPHGAGQHGAGQHGAAQHGAGRLRRADGGGPVSVAAEYLALGLALPFLVLALVRRGDLAGLLLAFAVPAAAGAGIALRAGRTARTYTEAGEALADTLVAHTARGERARIARELHDVVAHHISMIAVLAETGRLATPGLPEAGARRFGEIGDTARAGLTEMRRLLGVLREDAAAAEPAVPAVPDAGAGGPAPGGGALAFLEARGSQETRMALGTAAAGKTPASRHPQPGLAQLTELVDAAREASVAGTRLIISGPVAPLDPGVELAAYRIVQEALTNARRHAQGAAVDVELRYGTGTLRLRVRDNGPGPVTPPEASGLTANGLTAARLTPGGKPAGGVTPSDVTAGGLTAAGGFPGETGGGARAHRDRAAGGHGLLGMRERAFSVGGALYVGAAPGGGFLVEAVLPSEPDPVRAARPATAGAPSVPTRTRGGR